MAEKVSGGPTKVVAFRLPLEYAAALDEIAADVGKKPGPMVAGLVMKRIDEVRAAKGNR